MDDFPPRKHAKDGKHSYCRECICEMTKEIYHRNPRHYLDKMKKMKDAIHEIVDRIKSERGCHFCKERDPIALDFHHLDPTIKDESICRLIYSKNKERVLKEIEKCIVICANDHRKLEAGKISL